MLHRHGGYLHRFAGFSTVLARDLWRRRSPVDVVTGRATTSPRPRGPRRTAAACSTAPGLSPCTHRESTGVDLARPAPPRARRSRRASSSSAPGSVPGQQPAVGAVPTVGEALGSTTRPARSAPRSSAPGMPSTGSDPEPVEHRGRLLLVVDDPVVERAVRLDVAHRGARRGRDRGERPDLVGHLLAEHVGGDVAGDPAEVLPVVVGDLRPDRDTALGGLLAHRAHDLVVARVVAAGHVGAGHDGEQRRVVGDLLAEVGVEVDVPRHGPNIGLGSAGDRFPAMQPPVADRRPVTTEHHGRTRVDDYEWLRAKGTPEVTSHLEAENAYTQDADRAPRRPAAGDLRGDQGPHPRDRPVGADAQPRLLVLRPLLRGPRVRRQLPGPGRPTRTTGRRPRRPRTAHPTSRRCPARSCCSTWTRWPRATSSSPWAGRASSPDGTLLAYSTDVVGDERYTIRVLDLATGEHLADEIVGVIGGATWDRAGEHLYYTTVDESWRADKIWRHRLGHEPGRRRAGPPRAGRPVLRRRRAQPQRPVHDHRGRLEDHLGVPLPRRRRTRARLPGRSPSAARGWSTPSTTR